MVHGQGALKVYGNRALHFEAFSDAVFELIDLYTPTTKLDQYVGYIRALFRAIVKRGREWRYCWPVPPGDETAVARLNGLMAALKALGEGKDRGEHETALMEVHKSWCKAERSAQLEARAAEEAASAAAEMYDASQASAAAANDGGGATGALTSPSGERKRIPPVKEVSCFPTTLCTST